MSEAADETRRSRCTFLAEGLPGGRSEGEAEAVVTDDGLSAGPVVVEWLDVDGFLDAERALTLSLWPAGTLRLSMLGRRHETFARAAAEARDRARVAGMLAHGIAAPQSFDGSVLSPGLPRAARLLVYATHVTAVPEGDDPFQVPFGAVESIRFQPEEWRVDVTTAEGAVSFGHLGRLTDAFARALEEARAAQARRLAQASGVPHFADGRGFAARDLPAFESLREAFTAPEREESAKAVLARAERDACRLGLVELLDPDADALAAKRPLGENLAAFLLAPVGRRVALEVLSGPAAATYVFEGEIEALNRDLAALHFRRRPLALTGGEAEGSAGRPYRLALRRLGPLRRLRAAVRARIVHAESWGPAFERALAG